ncbi:hypothetical protein ACJ41O_004580 [Fusarium nematophilum]
MAQESTLRQRKPLPEEAEDAEHSDHSEQSEASERSEQPEPATPTKEPKKRSSTEVDEEDPWDGYTPYVDVLRVLSFLLLASCGLSYVISGGESWWWGMKHRPDLLTARYYKELLTGPPPPTYMTLEELSAHDGADADKPLLLAINGTIFDVSSNRRMYGPGGPYSHFAGVDAARGFVTGCFKEDRTADLRGIEAVFLPVDDPETDAHWTEEELAALKVKELEEAKKKAHEALLHWVTFFGKSKKYSKVGYLVREEGWLEKEEPRELCEQAQSARKKRKIPTEE